MSRLPRCAWKLTTAAPETATGVRTASDGAGDSGYDRSEPELDRSSDDLPQQSVQSARNTDRCASYRDSVRLSVCLSVCPSVTLRYCVQTNKDTNNTNIRDKVYVALYVGIMTILSYFVNHFYTELLPNKINTIRHLKTELV